MSATTASARGANLRRLPYGLLGKLRLGAASKPPALVLNIARPFADQRDAVNDGYELDMELGKLQVGAEAQFEVLAWINQMGNVAEHLGPEAFAEADARVRALTGAPRLAMHLARLFLAHGLLAPGAVADAGFIGNTAMMNAVLLASLCACSRPDRHRGTCSQTADQVCQGIVHRFQRRCCHGRASEPAG